MVRKLSGLVSPHRGCTPNKFFEQFGFAGASLTLTVTLLIGQILVQRVGVGSFYQARRMSIVCLLLFAECLALLRVPNPKVRYGQDLLGHWLLSTKGWE